MAVCGGERAWYAGLLGCRATAERQRLPASNNTAQLQQGAEPECLTTATMSSAAASPKVGVSHLARAVDDAAHDSNGHAGQVAGARPDLVSHLLQAGGQAGAWGWCSGTGQICKWQVGSAGQQHLAGS